MSDPGEGPRGGPVPRPPYLRVWMTDVPLISSSGSGTVNCTAQKPGIYITHTLHHTWNLESRFHWQRLESGVRGVESRIQDCLGFLYMERSTLLKRKDGPLPSRNIRLESQTRRAIYVSLTELNAMAKRRRQWESVYSHVLIKLYFLHPRRGGWIGLRIGGFGLKKLTDCGFRR